MTTLDLQASKAIEEIFGEKDDSTSDVGFILVEDFLEIVNHVRGTEDTVFDIETGPKPDSVISRYFDPNEVKLGNIKDEEKAKAKVSEAWDKFREQAALHAHTNEVLCIQYRPRLSCPIVHVGSEEEIVMGFWRLYSHCKRNGTRLIGFNINEFDLPILRRKAWMLDVQMPDSVMERNRYWASLFVDLYTVWKCGERSPASIGGASGLGSILGCRHSKTEVNGKDFHIWFKEDRGRALQYAANDVELEYEQAKRLGVIS